MLDGDDIDGSHALGHGAQGIKERNDVLFAGYGDIESAEVRARSDECAQFGDALHGEVGVNGIDALAAKLFVEECSAEAMAERIAYESECFHEERESGVWGFAAV